MIKKSLAVVLSLIMILSCMTAVVIPAGADAPTGTPISSLAEISDLTADYYLTADIGSAGALGTTTLAEFTGTLDGNGKTIYTSVPVFASLGEGAEVKNLTIKGAVTAADESAGVLAKIATGSVTLTDVTNEASMTWTDQSSATKIGVGGIIGAIGNMAADKNAAVDTDTCTLTMTRVVNKGAISATSTSKLDNVGGLVGGTRCAVVATDCQNSGSITIEAENTQQMRVGGIIGQGVYLNNSSVSDPMAESVFTRCINKGAIENKGTSVIMCGGILGMTDTQNTYSFVDCTNDTTGTITEPKGGKIGGIVGVFNLAYAHSFTNCENKAVLSGTNVTGGIVGQDVGAITAINCKNSANLTNNKASGWCGGIIAYASGANAHTYVGCSNSGTLTSSRNIGGIVGHDVGIVVMSDCQNSGKITTNRNETIYAGGMIGYYKLANSSTAIAYFQNCVNTGDFEMLTTSATNLVAGVVGYSEAKINQAFVNCYNSGDITVSGPHGGSKPAGIVASVATGVATHVISFIGCVNDGDIEAYSIAGGICSDIRNITKFVGCINNGNITAIEDDTVNTPTAGGILGTGASHANASKIDIYNCENTGDIANTKSAGKSSSVIAAWHASATVTVKSFKNTGALTGGAAKIALPEGTEKYLEGDGVLATVADLAGVQRSTPVQGETTFSLRVVTSITNIDDYAETGMTVYMASEGSVAVNYTNKSTDTVYTQISANTNGVNEVYPASPVANTYFAALTINGISTTGTHVFVVVPYTIDVSLTGYAEGAAYIITVTDGEIVEVAEL